MPWCKNDPEFVRNLCLDAGGHHAEGITILALPVIENKFCLRQVSAPANCAVSGSSERTIEGNASREMTMAKAKQKTVLFLCTGNYYRSRFAEVLFDSVSKKLGLPWRASSRGLALERGVNNVGPMAPAAIKALESMGIRDAERYAKVPAQVTTDELEKADKIIALKKDEHLPLFQERFPAWAEKVEFWHIDDAPEALALIEHEIMDLVARFFGGGGKPPPQASVESQPTQETAKKPMTVKVGRETAGRRGKGVTTVFDVPLDEAGLLDLAAKLKQRCGTGGTVKDGRIEIQGDQRERLVAELEKLGYKVKRVGG
jgi:translation initiation factor 1